MSQSDPRFRQAQKPLLYREVVTKLRERPRPVTDLLGDLIVSVEWDVSPSVSVLEKSMRQWREAGAVYDVSVGARQARVWYASRNAMAKHVIQRALGDVHGLLPDEATGEVIVNGQKPYVPEPEPEEHTQLSLIEPEVLPPVDRLTRMVQAMPTELWQASMTRDGVLISYDQYHRVIALLAAITELEAAS